MKKSFLLVIAAMLFFVQLNAQDVNIPQIGVKAPSFNAQSTNGTINFPSDFGRDWKIIFSHPKDFTPVCSSEVLELAYAQDRFKKLNTDVIVVSTDIMEHHNSWKAALEEIHYKDRDPVKIHFPIVADNDMKIAKKYGMIHSATSVSENIRGVYFIDPDNTIRAIQFYPNQVGRNVDEIERTLVALQTVSAQNNIVTPANWKPGDDMIVPVLSEDQKKGIGGPGSEFYQLAWFMTFKKAK
jgi:peroxiredoxin (alkyl hydroperoxide reductase subunit C)